MYFEALSDSTLLQKTDQAVQEERRITLQVLQLFSAIETRMLYSKEGYASLFEMAVKRFHYSEGQAQRRISAARLLRHVPVLEEKVQSGELKVSQLAQVQSFLRAERKEAGKTYSKEQKFDLITSMTGKSTQETEKALLEISPALQHKKLTQERARVLTPEMTELRVVLDSETYALLEEAKALFSHGASMNPPTAQLIQKGLKLLIEKKKKERGLTQPPTDAPVLAITKVEAPVASKAEEASLQRSRHIPLPTRRLVFHRAQNRCEYRHPRTLARCTSQTALEIDHIKPFAKQGNHKPDNLRIYCRAHNQLVAQEEFPVRA